MKIMLLSSVWPFNLYHSICLFIIIRTKNRVSDIGNPIVSDGKCGLYSPYFLSTSSTASISMSLRLALQFMCWTLMSFAFVSSGR